MEKALPCAALRAALTDEPALPRVSLWVFYFYFFLWDFFPREKNMRIRAYRVLACPFLAATRLRTLLLLVPNIVHHSRGGGALEAMRAVNVGPVGSWFAVTEGRGA